MKNIESTKDKGKRRNKNGFFGGDLKELINNTKPHRG